MSKKKSLWSLLAIMMVAMLSFGFVSCSSNDDDEEDNGSSSLVGTKWTVTYLGDKYIVEFTSNTDVIQYEADANNNYTGYMHEDKYTLTGNVVTFTNQKLYFADGGITIIHYNHFIKAEINGNIMKLITKKEKVTIDLKTLETTREYEGEGSFTLMKIQK